MTIVASIIAVIIIFAFHLTSKTAVIALYLALISQVLMVMKNTVDSIFIAYEKMFYSFSTIAISRLLSILLLFIAIYYDLGILGLFAALIVANAVGFLWAFSISAYRFARPEWNTDLQQTMYIFKESLPVGISTFLSQVYTYINVFFLKAFKDIVQVSLFQAPQRVISPLSLIPASFLLAFVPTLSKLGSNYSSNSNLEYAYYKTLKYMFIFTTPIAIFGTLYAPMIVLLLFGKEFSEATTSFQILIWTIVPLFGNALLSFLLTSIRKQKVLIIGSIFCLMINCLLGYILVNKYGHIGASLTSLFSYIVLFMVNFYFVSKYLKFIPDRRIVLQLLFACSMMYLYLSLLGGKLHMVPLMISAFLIYLGLLFLAKTFTSDEIRIFKSVITRSS
jgi:O-antigen/teichoic acid export membrane protein